jgi:hypothetical protein
MIAWAMAHRGDTIELDARIHAWEVEARERGDHFMLTNLLAFPLPYQRLIADDVAGAESILREALERWPYSGFHIQHVSVLFSRALVMLYQGDGVRAYTEVNRKWPIMVRSLQTRNQVTRVMLRDVRARGALAAAAAGIDRTTSLARAARDARLIEREGGGWITGYVARLRAGLAAVRGDAAAAERELRSAHAALDASGLVLQAAVARRQLGLLIGGDEGRQLVVDSASLLRDRDVADVDAITRMLGVALS